MVPNYLNVHSVIKFWARKQPNLILNELPGKTSLIADPFCGSGSTGFATVIKKSSALLSDLNPVSVFITYSLLNKTCLENEIIDIIRNACDEIEKEIYTINGYLVNSAIWVSYYECPLCGNLVKNYTSFNTKGLLICKKCKANFFPANAREISHVKEIHLIKPSKNSRQSVLRSRALIRNYESFDENLSGFSWYPRGEFKYNERMKFRDGPHRDIEIKDMFTKRNLYAISKIYHVIESIWKEDKRQGDLLKLAFIATLANASKMIPHAPSSGPSWKLPRYWIPPLRREMNFCRSFLRRLKIIKDFKEHWLKIIRDYNVFSSWKVTDKQVLDTQKFLMVSRKDARDAYEYLPRVDAVVLDPPHYDEINYFEMTYLWQKWLEGRFVDRRFTDYSFWKREICVNPRIALSLREYEQEISNLVTHYAERLTRLGCLILILHNVNKDRLKETIIQVKQTLGSQYKLKVRYKWPQIPSSTQGLNGSRKYLCIIRICH